MYIICFWPFHCVFQISFPTYLSSAHSTQLPWSPCFSNKFTSSSLMTIILSLFSLPRISFSHLFACILFITHSDMFTCLFVRKTSLKTLYTGSHSCLSLSPLFFYNYIPETYYHLVWSLFIYFTFLIIL